MGNILDLLGSSDNPVSEESRLQSIQESGCIITSKQFLRALYYGSTLSISEFNVTLSPDLSRIRQFHPRYKGIFKFVPLQDTLISVAPSCQHYTLMQVRVCTGAHPRNILRVVFKNEPCTYEFLCKQLEPDHTPKTFFDLYAQFSPDVFGIEPVCEESSLYIGYEWF